MSERIHRRLLQALRFEAAMTEDDKLSILAAASWLLIIGGTLASVWFFWTPAKLAYARTFGDGVEYYANHYGVLPEHVLIEKEPHDCETEVPPMGKKYCHYEKVVEFQGKD